MENLATYKGKRVTHTFADIARAARWLVESAESVTERQERGAFYPSMMAIVATAFMVEAALNHLGIRLFDDWLVIERKLGPEKKMRKILERLAMRPNWSATPYKGIHALWEYRNALAHGKTETVEGNFEADEGQEHKTTALRPAWTEACAPDQARKLFSDASDVVAELFEKAGISGDLYCASILEFEQVTKPSVD
ncbi:hypothetical protein ACMHYB_10045 [Sorangium sp. So ce1128]